MKRKLYAIIIVLGLINVSYANDLIQDCQYESGSRPTSTQILVWANEAIVDSLTFDDKNYNQRLKEIQRYYAKSGWQDYAKLMQQQQVMPKVREYQLAVSAVAAQPPVIKAPKQKMAQPSDAWIVEMPVLVNYKASTRSSQQILYWKLQIGCAEDGVRGLQIVRMKYSPAISPSR